MLTTFAGHEGPVVSATFSPDGRRIVTASADHTARVWDVETSKALTVLAGHKDGVLSAAFSPDGRRVLTASNDETARLWEVFPTTQGLVDSGKAAVRRCLTPWQQSSFYLSPGPPGWCYTMKKLPYQDEEPPPSWYVQAWNEATDWIAAKFNDLRGKLGLGTAAASLSQRPAARRRPGGVRPIQGRRGRG
jgi:WD40 repeat protein